MGSGIILSIIIIAILIIDIILRCFFPSFLGEKGKNLATKQDVQEITKLTEEVHSNFRENFEIFSTDLKFKSSFIYKQYSELYCKLYEVIVQSEYLRKYTGLVTGKEEKFEDVAFFSIKPTKRTTVKTTYGQEGKTVKREVTSENKNTPISDFNIEYIYMTIINNADLSSQHLIKLAVSYRFVYTYMDSEIEGTDKKRIRDITINEEDRLKRELLSCIVIEYNRMRKMLNLDFNELEMDTGRIFLD